MRQVYCCAKVLHSIARWAFDNCTGANRYVDVQCTRTYRVRCMALSVCEIVSGCARFWGGHKNIPRCFLRHGHHHFPPTWKALLKYKLLLTILLRDPGSCSTPHMPKDAKLQIRILPIVKMQQSPNDDDMRFTLETSR